MDVFLPLSVNRHSVVEHDIFNFESVIRRKTAGPVNKVQGKLNFLKKENSFKMPRGKLRP